MADVTKIAVKNLNLPLLMEELAAAGLGQPGLLLAGFVRFNAQHYQPLGSRSVIGSRTAPDGSTIEDEADPGELRFRFPADLTGPQDTALVAVLAAHVAAERSTGQTNEKADQDAIAPLVNNFQNWGALSAAEKDNNHRQLTRLVARLLDSSQNV